MRKGKSIEGLKVIGQTDGTDLGTVKDVIFDHETVEVLALLVSERELFGLIDAQVVPWSEITTIGPDAIMVRSRESVLRAGDDARIHAEMSGEKSLSGKAIHTTDGRDLGAFTDIYFEDDGTIVGYEVSGGLFADAVNGRRFMSVPESFVLGDDVALVPPSIADEMEAQQQSEPGGLKGAAATVGDKVGGVASTVGSTVGGVASTVGDKVGDVYGNIASASVEKQKEFVVGKVASRDVFLPASQSTLAATSALTSVEAGAPLEGRTISELGVPTPAATADVSSSGEIVPAEILVRSGETITQSHADRAETAGILHQLLLAAGGTTAGGALDTVKEKLGGATAAAGDNAEEAAIGRPAAREVVAPDGTILVAPGMTVTREIMERARLFHKEREIVASAGLGAASAGMGVASERMSSGVDTVKDGAANLWDTVKQKASELTGAAHEKKVEYDAQAEQARINNALGRPVTRVILDQQDNIILNTGDLITHAAINQARDADALEILFDSVYTADPEITPEMLRASEPGEAALPTQAQPTGGPITATVAPDQPAQSTPSQG